MPTESHLPSRFNRTGQLVYREVLSVLLEQELVYPCTCTRSDIAAASAPHETVLDGQVYPGTCSHYRSIDCERFRRDGIKFSLRFRTLDATSVWNDTFCGKQSLNVAVQLGDFIIWRSDDQAAYQLAVVVDDHDMEVNQVVRGADLIYSTYRQIAIHAALQWKPPEYVHVPLVVGRDGKRLAKRHGDTRIAQLREIGVQASQLVGYLSWKSGLIAEPRRILPKDLLHEDPLTRLDSQALVFDLESELPVIQTIK